MMPTFGANSFGLFYIFMRACKFFYRKMRHTIQENMVLYLGTAHGGAVMVVIFANVYLFIAPI